MTSIQTNGTATNTRSVKPESGPNEVGRNRRRSMAEKIQLSSEYAP
jgi:hypothetical protein